MEEVLLSSPYKQTAKAYIIYRDQHARIREIVSQADVDLIDRYLERADWQVNENTNMAYSLQGLNNYVSSEVSKVYWLNKIYPPRSARRTPTATSTSTTWASSRSTAWAGTWRTCCCRASRAPRARWRAGRPSTCAAPSGQIVNFFYTLQGEAAGAQAFSHFDTLLAPFIRYDGLDLRRR